MIDKILKELNHQSDKYASKDCYMSFRDLEIILKSLKENNNEDAITTKH